MEWWIGGLGVDSDWAACCTSINVVSRKEVESFERASGLNEIPIRCIVSCFFCSFRMARHGKQAGRCRWGLGWEHVDREIVTGYV